MSSTSYTFRAMNTDITLEVPTLSLFDGQSSFALGQDIEDLFTMVETSLSRFLPTSELSQVNAVEDSTVSHLFADYLHQAQIFSHTTQGLFDPTINVSVLGYDKSFEKITNSAFAGEPANHMYSLKDVDFDAITRLLKKPLQLHFDFGGMAKGYTVDKGVARVRDGGIENFYLDAGGDGYASGYQEDTTPWHITIQNPFALDDDLDHSILITNKAVATSSRMKRYWKQGVHDKHHLVDPRTGDSSATDLVAVTVIADTCIEADVYAKVLLILGNTHALAYAKDNNLAYLAVTSTQEVVFSSAFEHYFA